MRLFSMAIWIVLTFSNQPYIAQKIHPDKSAKIFMKQFLIRAVIRNSICKVLVLFNTISSMNMMTQSVFLVLLTIVVLGLGCWVRFSGMPFERLGLFGAASK